MDIASPPDAGGVSNHRKRDRDRDDLTTDTSTVHGYDDCLSLSGTTQLGEQLASTATYKPEQPEPSLHTVLQELAGPGCEEPLFGELVPAHNSSVDNPIVRASHRAQDTASDPRLQCTPLTNCSGVERHMFWDFVHKTGSLIDVQGRFEALFDLDLLTLNGGFVRQVTSGRGLLCGLHALVVSLNAQLAPTPVATNLPRFTVRMLQDILAGDAYRHLCMTRNRDLTTATSPTDAESLVQHTAELMAPRHLSVEQLAILVHIVGNCLGCPLQLGVVASTAPDVPDHPSALYEVAQHNFTGNAGARTIWLVNDCYGGDDQNHWSGMAPDADPPQPSHAQVAKPTPRSRRQQHGDARPRRATPAKKVANIRLSNTKKRPSRTVASRRAVQPTSPPPPDLIFCPDPECKRFHAAQDPEPFRDMRALAHHENTVHLPYEQREHTCDICEKRFIYPKDLTRHKKDIHDCDHPQWCLVDGCAMGGPTHRQRASNLSRHYNNVHKADPGLWEFCKQHFGLREARPPRARRAAATAV